MSLSYSVGIYIGRFQPLHKGHNATIKAALAQFEYLIILIGSTQESRTCRNPWNYQERVAMVTSTLTSAEQSRVIIARLPDFPTDDSWIKALLKITAKIITKQLKKSTHQKLTVVGYSKDTSSYYLKLLPWPFQEIKHEEFILLSSTDIREKYFNNDGSYNQSVPVAVAQWLKAFKQEHPVIFKRIQSSC